ncbi:hypothetical protein ES708_30683 [subsurface metagenome]
MSGAEDTRLYISVNNFIKKKTERKKPEAARGMNFLSIGSVL